MIVPILLIASPTLLMISLSGRSRPGHKVSGTRSKFPNLNENGQKSHFLRDFSDSEFKFPNLNENGQKSHFLRDFSDSEPGQHFV